MPTVRSYPLPPTKLIPNSEFPLLHYPGLLADKADCNAAKVYDLFTSNGWSLQWIWRYGPTQASHYHSTAHECMAVLSGSAKIRFGVADTSDDLEASTHGPAHEDGGIVLDAKAGDVFLIPAGVSHKTHDTSPPAELKLLTPGNGHGIAAENPRQALVETEISGFTMMGAYPEGYAWDSCLGGEHERQMDKVRTLSKPARDPVLGNSPEGICGKRLQRCISGGYRSSVYLLLIQRTVSSKMAFNGPLSADLPKSPYNPDDIPQVLRTWLDSDHETDITSQDSSSTFLHKPMFKTADLQNALIYARNNVVDAVNTFLQTIDLAVDNYQGRISVENMKNAYGGTHTLSFDESYLEDWEWHGEFGELRIFDVKWAKLVKSKTDKEPTLDKRFRRTIAALCRLRTVIEKDDGKLRREILKEQDEGKGPDSVGLKH
ncbi:hypothetical protein LTR10_010230 [Elasticomyces elasticus]|nr:hypothetical protein LTR10_010230 [Elasticomyces elasticus]KAK4972134.1 hypothetical protein LTR42_006640 [Elasticomyces elasticus]